MASRKDCLGGSPACWAAAPSLRMASAHDSGMHSKMMAEKMKTVGIHPLAAIIDPAKGENRNWPNEPAAVPSPNANDRRSGGNNFPNAPMTRLNEQAEMPRPTKTPAVSVNESGVEAQAISDRPSA